MAKTVSPEVEGVRDSAVNSRVRLGLCADLTVAAVLVESGASASFKDARMPLEV